MLLLPPLLVFVTIYFFMRPNINPLPSLLAVEAMHRNSARSEAPLFESSGRTMPPELQLLSVAASKAYWSFREYNELPHQVDVSSLKSFKDILSQARMCCAQAAAEAYIYTTRATSPVMKSGLRCVRFISGQKRKEKALFPAPRGSILAALLLVALLDDTPLLFVKIWDKNLLWYLAFFGFIFAVVDSEENSAGDSEGASA